MRTIRMLVAAGLLAGAAVTATPAQAAMYSFYYEQYDPVYSLAVGRPCTLQTWTYVDTAAVPPVRFVSTHYCSV